MFRKRCEEGCESRGCLSLCEGRMNFFNGRHSVRDIEKNGINGSKFKNEEIGIKIACFEVSHLCFFFQ